MSSRSHHLPSSQPIFVYELSKNHLDVKYRQYERMNQLGQGGFATCYKTKRLNDNKIFAMKVISLKENKDDKSPKEKHRVHHHKFTSKQEKAAQEAKFLKMCQHENIVKFQSDFIFEGNFYIIMQYCQKGSLGQMLKRRGLITQVQARYYIVQIIRGLQYLKQRNILHRDLKPGNFLLTSSLQLKIADFGLATMVTNNIPHLNNICGTPNFISPEMLEKKEYSYEVDLWSVGVILYSMLYGIAPFQTKNKSASETYDKIRRCDYANENPNISSEAKDLINKILTMDPKKRITLEQMLQHPFISSFPVPKQLPTNYCYREPSDEFLNQFQTKWQQYSEMANKNPRSIKILTENPSLQREGTNERDNQSEKRREEPFQQSFASNSGSQWGRRGLKSREMTYSRKIHADKKHMLQDKKHRKRNAHQSSRMSNHTYNPRPNQISRKYQKQQMLTSNPLSNFSSSNRSSATSNKCLQHPPNPSFVKINEPSVLEMITAQRLVFDNLQKQTERQNEEISKSIDSIRSESMQKFIADAKKGVFQEQLKQFIHGLRQPLSFDVFHEAIEQEHMKKEKSLANKDIQKIIEQTPYPLKSPTNNPTFSHIWTLNNFFTYAPSIYHISKDRSFKLIYLIEPQTLQPSTQIPNHKFIGMIFNDNSSIVIRISSKKKVLGAIYVKNVMTVTSESELCLSKPMGLNQMIRTSMKENKQNCVRNIQNKQTFPPSDILELPIDKFTAMAKDQHPNMSQSGRSQSKQKSSNNQNHTQHLSFDLLLKIRHSQDVLNHYSRKLKQSPTQELQSTVLSPSQYPFVSHFTSSPNHHCFTFNNGMIHYFSNKKPRDQASTVTRLEKLFPSLQKQQNSVQKGFNEVIYWPGKRKGYLKEDFHDENSKQITYRWRQLTFQEMTLYRHTEEENKSIILNLREENFTNSPSSTKQHKFLPIPRPDQQKIVNPTENISKPQQLITQQLLSEVCAQFRNKMQLYYLRNMTSLKRPSQMNTFQQTFQQEITMKNGFIIVK